MAYEGWYRLDNEPKLSPIAVDYCARHQLIRHFGRGGVNYFRLTGKGKRFTNKFRRSVRQKDQDIYVVLKHMQECIDSRNADGKRAVGLKKLLDGIEEKSALVQEEVARDKRDA